MNAWQLRTNRESFHVNDRGEIARPGIGMAASGKWRIVGASRYNNFGRQVEYRRFPECMAIKDWCHKNGAARWRLRDFDYGTIREWGESVTAVFPLALTGGEV